MKQFYALPILNMLMHTDDYLTTKQITSRIGCNRRTVYLTMDMLETNGFAVDVKRDRPGSSYKYKYIGLYGIDE